MQAEHAAHRGARIPSSRRRWPREEDLRVAAAYHSRLNLLDQLTSQTHSAGARAVIQARYDARVARARIEA